MRVKTENMEGTARNDVIILTELTNKSLEDSEAKETSVVDTDLACLKEITNFVGSQLQEINEGR